MRHKHQRPRDRAPTEAFIESLAHDGRGIAHVNGKIVFIHGALPGERIRFMYERTQNRYDEGRVQEVLEPAIERVSPQCLHFGVCGGCNLQHLQATTQILVKQKILQDTLEHVGKVSPRAGFLPPLVAKHWGYRRKARLGVKYVIAKNKLLIGFRERKSSFITDVQQCEILHPKVGQHLNVLNATITDLSIRNQIPQIEMAMGDDTCVLVIRTLAPLNNQDRDKLHGLAKDHELNLYIQTGGPGQLEPLNTTIDLEYTLPDLNLRFKFQPLDFTQINLDLNRLLVNRILDLLHPQPHERILDLFCGIGNFTLPLATRANKVLGIEADIGLISRAKENAIINGINNCDFCITDLYGQLNQATWLNEKFDQVVLDPPRSGAMQVLPYLPKLGAKRILYISCLPATLARDAGILVNELGYTLQLAGVMDMFPHTAHVESLALFDKTN